MQKKPFSLEHVQLIRAGLKAQHKLSQLALFEVGISTVLRASDLLDLRVSDVVDMHGNIRESFSVKQQKTGRFVNVSLSPDASAALAALFASDAWNGLERIWPVSHFWYSKLVKEWATMAYLDPREYSTHSIRRTYPAHLYKLTGNHVAAKELLGHTNLGHTAAYLGVTNADAHALKKQHRM